MSILHNNIRIIALCVLLTLTVSGSPSAAYPRDPENAALLYYQAFLTLPEAEEPVDTQIRDYAEGKIELNEAIEDHVGSCRGAIELAVVASELPECDWGLRFSEGFNMLLSHLGQSRGLARTLIADARIKASEGNYDLALARCVTVLKMSRHIGDETLVSFLVATALDSMAGDCIGDLLGQIPPNAKTIQPLKAELTALAKKAPSLTRSMDIEREVAIDQLTFRFSNLMRAINPKKSEEDIMKEVRKLGGEAYLKKSRDYYSKYMASAISSLKSGSPYAQIHEELAGLGEKLEKEQEKIKEAILARAIAPRIAPTYGTMIRGGTHANALRAGVDIYLAMARTGRLPEKLPPGAPKDLFSGKGFEYTRTKAGFLLRCRGKDLDKDKVQEYEFKVAK